MNPAKQKGTAWESAVRDYLVSSGLDACRVVQMGARDQGDIHVGEWALEAKNVAAINLGAFVDQAKKEADNAGKAYGAAVVKRRGKGPAHGFIVIDLETFVRVVREVQSAAAVNELLGQLLEPVNSEETPGAS